MPGGPPTEDVPEPDREPLVREGDRVLPAFQVDAFNCPYCGVLAQQFWTKLLGEEPGRTGYHGVGVHMSVCLNCEKRAVWAAFGPHRDDVKMVKPQVSGGPRHHVDMPPDVRADYEEAQAIIGNSVRGACGLLRLATEKLVEELQTEGQDLNDRIGKLVAAGLPVMVQQALDSLRVIGNEAVHPGQMDLSDDLDTALGLFNLLNVIVEDRITRPKHIAEMYAKLPAGKLQGIVNRDTPKT
jgi:hypothetical protein